ncbi:MAG: DUF1934 domain-containing protein [Streptococcaceae bacterium]|nr:DUF1934 domain-containing protein [Streptococcaceae bacterium]MCL2681090.1 DUF1934 domain-containing protein [Streptococcaceae bacterium]
MQITVRNRIVINGEEERIKEVFLAEYKVQSGKTHLAYVNADDEKVMIKFDENELSMTRYTKTPIIMKFHKAQTTFAQYEGLGKLEIETREFKINKTLQNIKLYYLLSQNGTIIGHYHLRIDWKEINE